MLIAALLLALAAPETAAIDAEREYSPAYRQCLSSDLAAKGVTVAMATCTNEEWTRQDKRLNAAYAKAMATRSASEKTKLRNIQRAWIKARDTDCMENLSGGTLDMLEISGCRLEMTTVRAVELERMAPAR